MLVIAPVAVVIALYGFATFHDRPWGAELGQAPRSRMHGSLGDAVLSRRRGAATRARIPVRPTGSNGCPCRCREQDPRRQPPT